MFLDLSFKGLAIKEVPISVKYFKERKSRVANNLLNYAFRTLAIILRSYRDYYPVKFFWSISFIFFLPGFLSMVFFFSHFLNTGKFSGYLFMGFSGAFLLIVSLIFFIVGIFAEPLSRIRINQERTLYLLKKLLIVSLPP